MQLPETKFLLKNQEIVNRSIMGGIFQIIKVNFVSIAVNKNNKTYNNFKQQLFHIKQILGLSTLKKMLAVSYQIYPC